MKVLVFGCGSMGRRHVTHALALGHAVTVYDPEASNRPSGSTAAASYAAAWRSDPDAVIVASPAPAHLAPVMDALARGLRVLVEKPLALDARSAAIAIAGGDDRSGVGYNLRFHAGLLGIKAALPQLGPIRLAKFRVRCDMATWPGRTYATPLLEFSHEIDLACWWFGPATVAAATRSANGLGWRLTLVHQTVRSIIDIDAQFEGYDRGGSVDGDLGAVEWAWDAGSGLFTGQTFASGGQFPRSWRRHARGIPFTMTCLPDQTYQAELEGFLMRRPFPGASLTDGLAVLRLCLNAITLSYSA